MVFSAKDSYVRLEEILILRKYHVILGTVNQKECDKRISLTKELYFVPIIR